jgi:putative nucleotidyltransferase with HDIG domain
MNRNTAFDIVNQYIKNKGLVNHMLSVEAAMRYYAEKECMDVELWGLCGLLHDFDWEINPTREQHPQNGAPILRDLQVPESVIYAILAHSDLPEYPRVSRMEKGLFACDEITGLITAVALVRPSKSLYDLEASSVKKKWKDKAFAAGTNREEMEKGAEDFGIPLWDHVTNVIHAMQKIAPTLGLEGNLSAPVK